MGALDLLQRGYGLARSAAIYHGNPLKRRRARAFYGAFVRAGDLCFDVGAHLGDRTGHFLALGARVVALEPQPGPLAVLRRLYGRHPRVVIIAAAAGAAPGEAELAIDPAHPTVASLSPEWRARVSRDESFSTIRWRERRRVAVTTLDALIAAHGLPAFCKIDRPLPVQPLGRREHALHRAGLAQPSQDDRRARLPPPGRRLGRHLRPPRGQPAIESSEFCVYRPAARLQR